MKLLIINGSIHGRDKNCGRVVQMALQLATFKSVEVVHLAEEKPLERDLCAADAYLFITGTYWDSCGSVMQEFLESFTHLETDKRIIGKPAGVVALCHSVGGKTVLSNLQGVLSSFGFLLPPLTGIVLEKNSVNVGDKDSWSFTDIDVVLNNLKLAATVKYPWSWWHVDKQFFDNVWADEK